MNIKKTADSILKKAEIDYRSLAHEIAEVLEKSSWSNVGAKMEQPKIFSVTGSRQVAGRTVRLDATLKFI